MELTAEFPSETYSGTGQRKRKNKSERGDEGVEREEREPSKALGCNFSRYIRDGSRNDRRSGEQRRGKSEQKRGGEKVAREFPGHRDHGD